MISISLPSTIITIFSYVSNLFFNVYQRWIMDQKVRFISFVCLSLIVQNLLQFLQKFVEIFSHKMGSNWMNFVEIVGRFPLMDVELCVSVIHPTVMVKHSSSNLQISEANASCQSSQIVNDLIVLSEKLKDLLTFGVIDVEDFWFGDPGVVGAVGDWPGVVVAVESVEEHMIRQQNYKLENY